MKHPWDKTVLGTKQSLDKTFSANLRQNVPIFRDGLSVPENKTWHNFLGQNVPNPQKTFKLISRTFSFVQSTCSVVPVYNTLITFLVRLRLPCSCLGNPRRGPGVAAPEARPGPGGPARAAKSRRPSPVWNGKMMRLCSDSFLMTIRLHTKFGASLVHFVGKKFRDGFKCTGNDCVKNFIFKKCTVFCQKGQSVPKISGAFCPFCQKNLGRTVRPKGIFCPRDVLSQGPFCSRNVTTRDVAS
jgi:hypothetical protein